MQTVGPLSITAGVSLFEYDPAKFTQANQSVQVQNNTNVPLTCVVNGVAYSVATFTATTIPTEQAQLLTIIPTGIVGAISGQVTLVWLLRGEAPPIPDGPLVGTVAISGGATTTKTKNATYLLEGAIVVASGATGFIPSFPVRLLYGEVVYLLGIQAEIYAGSIVVEITHNGVAIPGLSAITINTVDTYFQPTNPVLVTDGDRFAPVVSSITSSPSGGSIDFVFSEIS